MDLLFSDTLFSTTQNFPEFLNPSIFETLHCQSYYLVFPKHNFHENPLVHFLSDYINIYVCKCHFIYSPDISQILKKSLIFFILSRFIVYHDTVCPEDIK